MILIAGGSDAIAAGDPPADAFSHWIGNEELTAPSDTRVLSPPFGGGDWGRATKMTRQSQNGREGQ